MEYKDVHPQIEQVSKSYQYFDPPPFIVNIQEFIRSAIRAVLEWLRQFGIGDGSSSDSSGAAYLLRAFLYIAGIACALIILPIIYRELKALQERNKVQEPRILASERLLSSQQWQAEASTFAENKEYRSACRALYLAALRLLHELNVLAYSPVRTNHEYYYALLHKGNLSAPFNNLASHVELVWFGQESANQEDYETCQQLFNNFANSLQPYSLTSNSANVST